MLVHDETIFVADQPVGRLTSGGYGHTLGRSVGIGVIERSVTLDSQFTLRCKGQHFPITVSTKPLYDPSNHRMLDESVVGSPHVST